MNVSRYVTRHAPIYLFGCLLLRAV